MSLESWKEEFYPVPANTEMSTREAILHSIKKWEGLLPKNLEKHKLVFRGRRIAFLDELDSSCIVDSLYISDSTCALCRKFYYSDDDTFCGKCPLFHVTKDSCGPGTSYGAFIVTGNPQPMIDDLRRALNMFDLGYTE